MSLVEARAIHTLVIAHKDCLARFGMDWFEHYLQQHGCKLVIINNEALSPESEMVQDCGLLSIAFHADYTACAAIKKS